MRLRQRTERSRQLPNRQAPGPRFQLHYLIKKPGVVVSACNPRVGRSVGSQLGLFQFQASERPRPRNNVDNNEGPEERHPKVNLGPPHATASTHTCKSSWGHVTTHTHSHAQAQEHIHAHAHKSGNMFRRMPVLFQ